MDDGLVRVEVTNPGERVDPPRRWVVGIVSPVQGSVPALGLAAGPTVGEPQAAGSDSGERLDDGREALRITDHEVADPEVAAESVDLVDHLVQ